LAGVRTPARGCHRNEGILLAKSKTSTIQGDMRL
jgi:hypothetical protein